MLIDSKVDRLGRHVLITLSALGLVACAGGGGGAAPATTISTTTVTPPAPPPPPPPPPGPSATSAEFTRSYGLGAIHAEAAYAAGASGAGVTVAVVDTGVDGSSSELSGRVSSQSTDASASRNTPVGPDGHATWVAGVLASNFDGQGTVGVAYGSTVLSIRADTASTSCTGSEACISSSLATTAIDYAIAHGAKVVNMSFSGQSGGMGAAFEAALQRGVNAGLIFAMAAGNDGNADPTWPAYYALDPRFAGAIVIAGATTQSGALAGYSNTAGAASSVYLAAPGDRLITGCTASGCLAVSGTSFATPEVAGAMALLLQAFPNMSGRQVVDLLWRTADDRGATGTDAAYGRGALDLQRAFQPVGALTVASASGAAVAVTAAPDAFVTTAVGDAIVNGGGLTTAGRDVYNRLFVVNLAQGYRSTGASIISAEPASITRSSDLDLPSFAQGRVHVSAALANGQLDPSTRFHWMLSNPQGGDLSVSYDHGGLSLTAWTGSGLANPFFAATIDPFTSVAQPDQAVRAAYRSGRFGFTAEAGSGQRLTPDRMQRQPGSRYLRAGGDVRLGRFSATVTAGELVEPLGPLGSYLPQGSGLALPSRTGFVSTSSRWTVAPGLDFAAEASLGRTRLQGAFLSTPAPVLSSAWRLSLDGDCRTLGLACTGVHLSLSQPLRIEQGRFSAVLPDVPTDPSDPLTFSSRSFSASPSGREVDLRLRADRSLGAAGTVSLEGVASRNPGNRADAPAAFGLLGGWRVEF
jgi:subtilisin family serine protease